MLIRTQPAFQDMTRLLWQKFGESGPPTPDQDIMLGAFAGKTLEGDIAAVVRSCAEAAERVSSSTLFQFAKAVFTGFEKRSPPSDREEWPKALVVVGRSH